MLKSGKNLLGLCLFKSKTKDVNFCMIFMLKSNKMYKLNARVQSHCKNTIKMLALTWQTQTELCLKYFICFKIYIGLQIQKIKSLVEF